MPQKNESTTEKGQTGEDEARAFLESKGYQFIQANYRTQLGELDLIMKDKNTLVFVEVKTLEKTYFSHPYEAVTPKKQRKLIKTALAYIKRYAIRHTPMRFDVISITPWQTEHFEDAFTTDNSGYDW